jgi:hypothetical protein
MMSVVGIGHLIKFQAMHHSQAIEAPLADGAFVV